MRDDAWKRVGPAELFDLAELYDAAGLHLEADGTYAGRTPLPPDENLAWYVEGPERRPRLGSSATR
ncbi:hypothetical protein [Nonomuraea dietziae]|uniref:hypothetical protein n=1 Tax=Nonomuraea dietziae TaxID=65515 RepID=UPI0033CE02ED